MPATATMSRRRIVKVNSLKYASWNPPNRIAKQNLRDLLDSMDLIGLLHPITITPENEIIDGHRRCTAAKILGWKEIECNVVDQAPEDVYASVNITARKMSGNDALGVWLKNPLAVHSRTGNQINSAAQVIGRNVLKKIFNLGHSLRVYRTALTIARYCDDMATETISMLVQWLLDVAVIGQVMKAIEAGVSPKDLMRAAQLRKPIKFKIDLE